MSGKFKKISEIYKIFGEPWNHVLDFSDSSLIEMYNSESYGIYVSKRNGFSVGKSWMNVNVAMWKEDIAIGILLRRELLEDQRYPKWWIEK